MSVPIGNLFKNLSKCQDTLATSKLALFRQVDKLHENNVHFSCTLACPTHGHIVTYNMCTTRVTFVKQEQAFSWSLNTAQFKKLVQMPRRECHTFKVRITLFRTSKIGLHHLIFCIHFVESRLEYHSLSEPQNSFSVSVENNKMKLQVNYELFNLTMKVEQSVRLYHISSFLSLWKTFKQILLSLASIQRLQYECLFENLCII